MTFQEFNIRYTSFQGSHTYNISVGNWLARPSSTVKVRVRFPGGLNIHNPSDTSCLIHIDLRWILHRYVEDQISTNFHVISTYFFRCNFDGKKIHVVSTCFFRCNLDGRKIHVVSTYFFWCNFSRQNIYLWCFYLLFLT